MADREATLWGLHTGPGRLMFSWPLESGQLRSLELYLDESSGQVPHTLGSKKLQRVEIAVALVLHCNPTICSQVERLIPSSTNMLF